MLYKMSTLNHKPFSEFKIKILIYKLASGK
jgi:hypothetical protein